VIARLVVRIMLMVPLYAISSLISLFSLGAAFVIDAVRDIYEVGSPTSVFWFEKRVVLALLARSLSLHFPDLLSIPYLLNVLTLCILPRLL
jgi:hypothetical protein